MSLNLWFRITAASAGLLAGACMAQGQLSPLNFGYPHPAIGSWFGEAIELCAAGDATCPKASLYMTPTVFGDGNFLGNDSFSFGGPPFGPHSTAHGHWVSNNGTDITVDYVFMLPGSDATMVTALRFRWTASVISANQMVGFVNIFFGPPLPVGWTALSATQYPTLPAAAAPVLTAPTKFYTDPTTCSGGPPACPLIFKFTVNRITQ